MYSNNPPPLSKAGWIWLREWQHKKEISDEDGNILIKEAKEFFENLNNN